MLYLYVKEYLSIIVQQCNDSTNPCRELSIAVTSKYHMHFLHIGGLTLHNKFMYVIKYLF